MVQTIASEQLVLDNSMLTDILGNQQASPSGSEQLTRLIETQKKILEMIGHVISSQELIMKNMPNQISKTDSADDRLNQDDSIHSAAIAYKPQKNVLRG